MKEKQNEKRLSLSLDVELYQLVKITSKDNQRSMSAEIRNILIKTFQQRSDANLQSISLIGESKSQD